MSEKFRITPSGDLLLSDNVNTRLPVITDGLVSHFPFDGTAIGMNCGDLYKHDGDFTSSSKSINNPGLKNTIYMEAEIMLYDYPSERYSFLFVTGPSTQGTSNLYLSVDSAGKVSICEHAKVSNGYHASNYKLELNTWYKVAHLSTPTQTIIIINGVIDRIIDNAQEYLPDIANVYRETGDRNLDGHGISRNVRISQHSPYYSGIDFKNITNDGLYIDAYNTNMLSNPTFIGETGLASCLAAYNATYELIDEDLYLFPELFFKTQRMYLTGSSNDGSMMNKGFRISRSGVNEGEIYTFSFYAYGFEKVHNISIYSTTIENTSLRRENINSKWIRYVYTFTVKASITTFTFYVRPNGNLTYDFDCGVALPQLEKTNRASSFKVGTVNYGYINYPFNLLPPYTINIDHESFKNIVDVVDQGSSPRIFQLGNYYSNSSISLWNMTKHLSYYVKGISSTGWTTSKNTNIEYTSETWNNKRHTYTLIVGEDAKNIRLFMDGEYVATTNSSEIIGNISGNFINLGLSNPYAKYRSLSIYNRVLTDKEVSELYNSKFTITNIKNIITSKAFDNNVLHLPLDSDCLNKHKIINPSINEGTNFLDGSLYVGLAYTNLVKNGISPYSGYHTTIYDNYKLIMTMKDSTQKIVFYVTNQTVYTKTMSVSGYMRKNGNVYDFNVSRLSTYQSDALYKYTDPETGYFEYIQTYSADNIWLFHQSVSTVEGDIITIDNLNVVELNNITPFKDGDNLLTKISFTNPDFLDFNEGTMGAWFKPTEGFFNQSSWNRVFGHSTNTNRNEIQVKRNSTNNNLCMSISNTDGSPQTTWSACQSAIIEPYNWYFVVARWNISTGKMSLTVNNIKSEQSWSSTYQPTVKGKLDIGYHSYTNRHSNSYFKDFFVAKYEMSDEEIGILYKEKINIKDGTLKIQNNIKTNQLLE